MAEESQTAAPAPIFQVFRVTALLLLLSSIAYNELLIGLLVALNQPAARLIRSVEMCFLMSGLTLACVVEGAIRWSATRTLLGRERVANLTLLSLALLFPIYILELSLRPFAAFTKEAKTTIYMKDPELLWKHRPNAEDFWDGKAVKINGKGLRGPELDYAKPRGTIRILYLGDSVTFGEGLQSYTETFPYVVEETLRRKLGIAVETINSGVSGYSPWQEHLYLSREGIQYQPDLVVIGFVLNDVTEKFELRQFGGSGVGWQLSHTYTSWLDRLADHSSIANVSVRLAARMRFGRNTKAGARQNELLSVHSLVDAPGRPDVKRAWNITLAEVDRIFRFCEDRRTPVLLVVFPFLFQVETNDASMGAPQKVITSYAASRGKPVIDLFPWLRQQIAADGAQPAQYFLDSSHLTPKGNQAAAQRISDFILEENLLPVTVKWQ